MSNNNNDDSTGAFSGLLSLIEDIDKTSSYTAKTALVAKFIEKFDGDIYLLCKLLLCKEDKRVYNIQKKNLSKLLSRYWGCSQQDMITDLEGGDASETARKFFKKYGKPASKSTLTLQQVDQWLQKLTTVTKEDDQLATWASIIPLCTPEDLRMLWRIVDHDLRINIGPKFVLSAMHPSAWEAYKNSNDLRMVIDRIQEHKEQKEAEGKDSKLKRGTSFSIGVTIMTPIKPMLANACKAVELLSEKCPNGAYAEIKYDGERIQIHKNDDEFKCFSRNLKVVQDRKLEAVQEFIPKATDAKSIILDCEILLMDTKKRKPLPFGTLGVHKAAGFKDAVVCLFVFDILYLNGDPLLDRTMKERRKLLEKHVQVVPNRVELSELTIVEPKKKGKDKDELEDKAEDPLKLLMSKVLKEGLEGLVVKDAHSVYEPAARHWLKIKKDYLSGLADSADLICLGAYFGTGNYGGMLSVFLVGVYDNEQEKFLTVCKIGNGFDEKTIHGFQTTLKNKMQKIERDPERVPDWLRVHRTHVPDYVAKDPKVMPVFEVAGAEFTESPTHTADGISIRFPRVLKIRTDKTWKEATDLAYLKDLQKSSVRSGSDNNNNNNNNNNNEDDEDVASSSKRARADDDDEEESNNNNNNKNKKAKSDKPAKTNNTNEKKNKNKIVSADDDEEMEDADNGGNDSDVKGKKPKDDPAAKNQKKDKEVVNILGDVTEPQGEPGNKIIVVCTDDTGKWGTKGIFAAINNRWPIVSEEFAKRSPALGTCQLIKVSEDEYLGKQWVGIVVGQKVSTYMYAPDFDVKSFETAIAALASLAQHKQSSIHMARLSPTIPKMDWDKVDKILVKYLVTKGIPTFVYSLTPVANTPKPAKGKEKKTKGAKKGKGDADDDEDDEDDAPPSKGGKKSDKNADKKSDKGGDKKTKDASIAPFFKPKQEAKTYPQNGSKQGKKHSDTAPPNPKKPRVDEVEVISKKLEAITYINELPSVFTGKVVHVHSSVEGQPQMERYIIAFDGNLDSGLGDDVTHIVIPSGFSDSEVKEYLSEHKAVHVVSPQWAWDCINTKKLRDEAEYK